MLISKSLRDFKFIFQPEGRKIKINMEVKEGKLFVNKKPFLHELFTFKRGRNIFILDEAGREELFQQSTISALLNRLIKDKVVLIKNSNLTLSN